MRMLDVKDFPMQRRSPGCSIPLTPMQMEWWTHCVKNGRSSGTQLTLASARIYGPLNVELLTASIHAVLQRHESLRTIFTIVDGTPTQHIETVRYFTLEVDNLSDVPPIDREKALELHARAMQDQTVDLSSGPVFDARLVRLGTQEHVLIVAVDHIISDAASCAILSRDTWTLYSDAAQGVLPSLPPLSLQFPDYAVWQQQIRDTCITRRGPYWMRRLAGAPRTELPLDSLIGPSRPMLTQLEFPFGNAESAALISLARRERTLLPLLVLALFATVLSRWCNQLDLVVDFVSHGRSVRPELGNVIGWFAHLLHFRIEMSQFDTFADVLNNVTLEYRMVQRHQHFGWMSEALRDHRPQVGFNWLPSNRRLETPHPSNTHDLIRVEPFALTHPDVVSNETSFGLAGRFDARVGIVMSFWYRSDSFTADSIARFARNMQSFAEEFARNPHSRIASMAFQ